MPAALTPITRWQILDNGAISPGAKLYTYASGTNTPLAVYNNADLAGPHAHTNPVVADAEGVLPVIFLAAVSYRFLVTDALGATIFPAQDDIAGMADVATPTQLANLVYAGPATGSAATPTFRALTLADLPAAMPEGDVMEGRLTLTTALPVTVSDVLTASTLYYAPHEGNRVRLYDGTSWIVHVFTELSLSLSGFAADTNFDIYVYLVSSVLTLEATAWTNGTTRATALVKQDGVWVKTGALTRRYVGTIRTTGTIGQTEDSLAKRFVYNARNRVVRQMRVIETADSWTYSTAAWRQARASAANQLALVVGLAEDAVRVEVQANGANSNSSPLVVGIGEDATNARAAGLIGGRMISAGALTSSTPGIAWLYTVPAVGYHFYAWIELDTQSAGGTTVWYGDNGGSDIQSGISGLWRA